MFRVPSNVLYSAHSKNIMPCYLRIPCWLYGLVGGTFVCYMLSQTDRFTAITSIITTITRALRDSFYDRYLIGFYVDRYRIPFGHPNDANALGGGAVTLHE